MGLFNNLRHRIVEKLIRPEDGYTFTGFIEDQPVKLYHEFSSDIYLFSRMKSGKWTYFEPTLSGWKEHEDGHLVHPVDFQLWMCGVLDNIHKQYMDKLNSLTQKEIRALRKNKNGEQILINKESFCDIMAALSSWENLEALEDVINAVYEDNVLADVFNSIIDELSEELEPDRECGETPVIWDWLFEMDAGRNEKAQEGLDGHPLTNAGELYDYLVWKRDSSESN